MNIGFFPTQQIPVESESPFQVGGQQFMPDHAPRSNSLFRLLGPPLAPFDQHERYHFRVSDDREAADVGQIHRRKAHSFTQPSALYTRGGRNLPLTTTH